MATDRKERNILTTTCCFTQPNVSEFSCVLRAHRKQFAWHIRYIMQVTGCSMRQLIVSLVQVVIRCILCICICCILSMQWAFGGVANSDNRCAGTCIIFCTIRTGDFPGALPWELSLLFSELSVCQLAKETAPVVRMICRRCHYSNIILNCRVAIICIFVFHYEP